MSKGKWKNAIPIPEDFASRAPHMLTAEAVEAWGVSTDTVRKWYRECGLSPIRPKSAGRPPKERGAQRDSDARCRLCLHCQRPDCPGSCAELMRLK